MKREISGRSFGRRRAHASTVFACALGVAMVACSDGVPDAASEPVEAGRRNVGLAFVDSEADAALTDALYAPPETLTACVQRHITESGSAAAVTTLSCPGDPDASCTPPDLSLLSSLVNLTALDLSYRCISDVGPIAALTQIERLELRANQVNDIRPLGALRELRSLGLENNQIRSAWDPRNQLPFSQLSKLVELNLNGTGYTNLHPLAALASLRVLHLQSSGVRSIRPLAPLTGLRELHVDHNVFEDRSALQGLTQLEVLSASDNMIGSIEPLRRLAQNGSLRSVSLDDNCVTSCDDLAGIESSCAYPRPSCESYETGASGAELSVPMDYVERLVPHVDLPVWTQAQVESAFELVSTHEAINWKDARGGCDARANTSASLLSSAGFPELTTVYAFGNLRPLTSSDPSGFFWFEWHVAVAARTAQGFIVFDPAVEPRPLTMREWYARLVDSSGADLNFSCLDYYAREVSPSASCTTTVDERGFLLVDAVQDLRGAICNRVDCPSRAL